MSAHALAHSVRVATFNVSMEASNYTEKGQSVDANTLFDLLKTGEHPQIKNIAQIIQTVRPDIILLNEFDYTADQAKGIDAFQKNYLKQSQRGQAPIEYRYVYTAPVNTGINSGVDFNSNGKIDGDVGDTFGFGLYPGQYGMALLSRYPIDRASIRTFQHFLWKDMPNNLVTQIHNEKGESWYSKQAQAIFRLSSKSHWDVPINIDGQTIHILASHPTPPVFDGEEDRNGKRNHDEIRFWLDYISNNQTSTYIYDDNGATGGLGSERFILLGDLNASATEGDGHRTMMDNLLRHPNIDEHIVPQSKGGGLNQSQNSLSKYHTASWGMRADYVLPSKNGLKLVNNGVFWPSAAEPDYALVADRKTSSDHRLVWVDVKIE